MDIFAKFATDPDKEANGTIIHLDDKTSLLVARFGNDKHMALLRELNERHKVILNSPDAEQAEKAAQDNTVEAMANHILVGWSGVEFKGQPLEYSVTAAKMLLGLNDFRNLVFNASRNIDNYRYDELQAIEKNSSAG